METADTPYQKNRRNSKAKLAPKSETSFATQSNSKADVHEPTPPYAVRNTGAGGCDGRISANAIWMMPPANPSATPMRQAIVYEPSAS
ncbi:hypothetical protein Bra1253DRAFT_08160 [Bradyrhizobium sp. WSM1253]|nr:hypothetical protein Bra1253DRAFT_08160 [Bradyrhizobium sp. WSM1253]